MTNSVIELHDSTISAVSQQEGAVIIYFSPAYIHKSKQRPGIDAGTDWVQDVKLTIDDALIHGRMPTLPEDVLDGDVVIGSDEHQNSIPIPLAGVQSITLHVEYCTGDHMTIKGIGALLELMGECKYVEDFVP